MAELRTERLLLRQWRDDDLEPFARLNADPETMRYFPAPLTRAQSDRFAERECARIAERGWGLWAVEVVGVPSFVGFVGLAEPSFEAHFTPAVEIGWRLAREHWGHGYATEAARAVIDHAFEDLGLERLEAGARVSNPASRRVLEKCGFQWSGVTLLRIHAIASSAPIDRFRLDRGLWASLKAWGQAKRVA
jgi:RimJ/RimL family protein N-acetyltransferase